MKIMPSKFESIKTLPIKKIAFGAFAVVVLGLGSVYILNKDASPPLKKIDVQKPIATPQDLSTLEDRKGASDLGLTSPPSPPTTDTPPNTGTPPAGPSPETITQGGTAKDMTQVMQTLALMGQSLADLHTKVDSIDKTVKDLKEQSTRNKTMERVTPKNRAGIAIPSNKGAFDIVGVDIKSLAIVVNKQSKIIAVGEELPNGAIFQGFDGKNVLTSKGPIRVDGAIAGQ